MKPQNLRDKFAKPDTEFVFVSHLATYSANNTHRNTAMRGLNDKKLLFSESF